MQKFLEDLIRRDLSSFADINSQVLLSDGAAEWTQGRRAMRVDFRQGADLLPEVVLAEQSYAYASFFASEHMADLPRLAESLVHSLGDQTHYVEGRARTGESREEEDRASNALLRLGTENRPFNRTRVVFFRGAAGAGKTFALRRLASEQALRVNAGEAGTLFLYIDAQARALARLDDAVALILSDLGASFSYRALSTLTRLGLVVPIVDGFDELIGAGGYGEAFNSLALFISRLEGQGVIIASARSAFLEYRHFRESANRYSEKALLNFEIAPVELLPWAEDQIESYLTKAGAISALEAETSADALEQLRTKVGEDGEEFLRTPFFLASIVELLKSGQSLATAKRIVPQAINFFVSREWEKIRSASNQPIASVEIHMRFLQLIAEEMWWQEVRELDDKSVRALAELAVDTLDLPTREKVTFAEKALSYAFLRTREKDGGAYLGFSHEYYHAYFLAQYMVEAVLKNDDLANLLSRGTLTAPVGLEFAHAALERNEAGPSLVEKLSKRRIPSLSRDSNRQNAGILFAGLIKVTGSNLSTSRFSAAVFVQSDLSESILEDVEFCDCSLLSCDLRGAKWRRVRFLESQMLEPIVSEQATRFDGTHLLPGVVLIGVAVDRSGLLEGVFDPREVAEILQRMGAPSAPVEDDVPLSDSAQVTIRLLRRVLRLAAKIFYLSPEDLSDKHISNDPHWKSLEAMMVRHNLVGTTQIQRRGTSGEVLRFVVPPSMIEQGEAAISGKPNIDAFWSELRRT